VCDDTSSVCRQFLNLMPNLSNYKSIHNLLANKKTSDADRIQLNKMSQHFEILHHLVIGYFKFFCQYDSEKDGTDPMYYQYNYAAMFFADGTDADIHIPIAEIVIKCVCSEGFAGPDGMPYHVSELSKNVAFIRHVEKQMLLTIKNFTPTWNDDYFHTILDLVFIKEFGLGIYPGANQVILYHQEYLQMAKMLALKIEVNSRHVVFMQMFIDAMDIALARLNVALVESLTDVVPTNNSSSDNPFIVYSSGHQTVYGYEAFKSNLADSDDMKKLFYLCFA